MGGRAVAIAAVIAAGAFAFLPLPAAPAATTIRADAWEDALDELAPLMTRAVEAEAAFSSAFDSNWRSHRQQLRKIVLRARLAWAALRSRVRAFPDGSKDQDAFTTYLVRAATKYIRSENAYLRALKTGRLSDLEAGDRLARQGNAALLAARRINNRISRPSSQLERDLRQLGDLLQANKRLSERGETLFGDMVRALGRGGIRDRDGVALKDALAAEFVYRQITSHFANTRPYQTADVRTIFNSFRSGFSLMHAAFNDYVAALRSHRLALLNRGDVKWQRGQALTAKAFAQSAALSRKLTG